MSTQTEPDQYLDVHGARLRWRLAGRGPAIVLLHGWALDLDYWNPVAALLTCRFTVLRFDRCGFGDSTGTPDIHRNVADLAALMDAAAMPRAVLVGMSQGARLAIHFALADPARTRGLLLDGAPALEAESEIPLDHYRRQLEDQGLAAMHAAILRHSLMQLVTGEQSAHRRLRDILARYRGHDLGQAAVRRHQPVLGAITAPTLILNGSHDSVARRDAGRTLQAAIPAAQRIELPDAGHLAALDNPHAYAAAVIAFCLALPA
jgi:pimeloyl-ACP methyl ester carboxylesterase